MSLGDHCFVANPLEKGVSARFQRRNFDDVYQVVEVHGDGAEAKAHTVCDLKGNREGLGFAQPVAAERLTPIELLPLAQPSEDQPTRILLNVAGQDRAGTVVNQTIDGKVYIRFDDGDGVAKCYDLATTRYQWLNAAAAA